MIRALRACLCNARSSRLVGLAILVAFVLVVVLGAAHAGEHGDGAASHDDCSVCVAAGAAFAAETSVEPVLLDRLPESGALAHADPADPVALEPRRQHAPRAPPAAA